MLKKMCLVILIVQFFILSFTSLLYTQEFGYCIAPQDYYDPSFKLFKAAGEANIALMKKLIKDGANVNEIISRDQPHGGYPILRAAIDSHSLETVQVLLNAGANPNEFTQSPIITDEVNGKNNVRNLSLLLHAINSRAPISIIRELIKYGANIDGTPKICSKWSALMVAAYRNYIDAIKIILKENSKQSKLSNDDLELALEIAKKQKNQTIVKILFAYKEKITLK